MYKKIYQLFKLFKINNLYRGARAKLYSETALLLKGERYAKNL